MRELKQNFLCQKKREKSSAEHSGGQVMGSGRQKWRLRWPGIEPGSTAWKATMLTITPPTPSSLSMYFDRDWSLAQAEAVLYDALSQDILTYRRPTVSCLQTSVSCKFLLRLREYQKSVKTSHVHTSMSEWLCNAGKRKERNQCSRSLNETTTKSRDITQKTK